jgi:hypothetical protein
MNVIKKVEEPKQKDCFNVKEREERRGNGMIENTGEV